MSFDSLGLSDFLLSSLQTLSYETATPVQEKAIPFVLEGRDLLAAAQTGSGKTAAFALPILQRYSNSLQNEKTERSLILVPTRELADQVGAAIQSYGQAMPQAPKTLTLFGGVSIDPQIEKAQGGCDIIVATPGRLLDLIERKAVSISEVNLLVLDEADRLLALGFADELNAILKLLPDERQNLLFSATFP
ncbi:MAG: DEAD/DEAH box helicase, partial [Opitutaceae bacterium]|nr:DEAD/DEAH box helicase [Opitutaceae bacterium]